MGAHHAHGVDRPHAAAERALGVALALNAAFLVLEAVVGWWTNSLALLSDAGHMVTDVGALTVALVAQRLSHRSGGSEYTYGLHRFPVVAGLANAVSLVVVVVLIVVEAIERFSTPVDIAAMPVLWTGLAGLAVNAGSAWFLHRSGDESVNIRGAMLHLLADMFGSVAAVASAIVLLTTGWTIIDPLLSLAIALLIAWGSYPLLRETLTIILERAPAHLEVSQVEDRLAAAPEVARVVDMHLWEVGPRQAVVTAVLEASGELTLAQTTAAADRLRVALADELGVQHATLEWRDPAVQVSPCHFEHNHDDDAPHVA